MSTSADHPRTLRARPAPNLSGQSRSTRHGRSISSTSAGAGPSATINSRQIPLEKDSSIVPDTQVPLSTTRLKQETTVVASSFDQPASLGTLAEVQSGEVISGPSSTLSIAITEPQASSSSAKAASTTLPKSVRPPRVPRSGRKDSANMVQDVRLGTTPEQSSPSTTSKGKSPATKPEKRVLPARLRRTAGGGAEGVRDLEEMIVDWLERWGEPSQGPPETLSIHLTTLPSSLLDLSPDPTTILPQENLVPDVIVTPTKSHTGDQSAMTQMESGVAVLQASEKIEVPSWLMVRVGDDDAEEAREELLAKRVAQGGLKSPVKRLRTVHLGEPAYEDTSDTYYTTLHKKYEVFERRQRIREKEKLQFERYKMRSRVELLRNMGSIAWNTVVSTVLSRGGEGRLLYPDWEKGREEIRNQGIDWLRDKLVEEGEEVLRRYDQLLPTETRKNRLDSRNSTPTPSVASPSVSPPPVALPSRVAALRDGPARPGSGRRRPSSPSGLRDSTTPSQPKATRTRGGQDSPRTGKLKRGALDPTEVAIPSSKRPVRTYSRRKVTRDASFESSSSSSPVEINNEDEETEEKTTDPSSPMSSIIDDDEDDDEPKPSEHEPSTSQRGEIAEVQIENGSSTVATPRKNSKPTRRSSIPNRSAAAASSPIAVLSPGVPFIVEAATRRESIVSETEESKIKAAGQKTGRHVAREKTRASPRIGLVSPFGMPLPASLDRRSEFTLTEEEDFWPIIADREAHATEMRRRSTLHVDSPIATPGGNTNLLNTATTSSDISPDEAREMREVEAVVVI